MRLAFAGTPEFAERALARLLAAGHEIALVLTQPDRPSGRGLRAVPGAVKRLALARGLEVLQPETLKDPVAVERLRATRVDALVVAAYGLLLPPAVLALASLGAVNIHASLLPRWRGAAPIQRALLAGDAESGISIMRMDAGLDTGPVLAQERIAIGSEDDAGTLHDRLAELGARMIVSSLAEIEAGRARAVPQSQSGVTYAPKIERRETMVDWSRSAVELERAVRAFRPAPGAATTLAGEPLKLWRARLGEGKGAPGTLLQADNELLVACGSGALSISEVQRPGGRRLAVRDFLRGRPLAAGVRLG